MRGKKACQEGKVQLFPLCLLGRSPSSWQDVSMSNNEHLPELPQDTTTDYAQTQHRETRLDPQFFQQVPNVLINDVAQNRLKPIDVIVYAILKKHQGQRPYCWVPQFHCRAFHVGWKTTDSTAGGV